MVKEQIKILRSKIIWIFIFVLTIALSFIIPILHYEKTEKPSIVNESSHKNEYSYEVEIEFNVPVESCDIQISFYNKNGTLLHTETTTFFMDGDAKNSLEASFVFEGSENIYGYKIIEFSKVKLKNDTESYIIFCFIATDIILFVVLLCVFTRCCRVYYYNDNEIIVYAGLFHNYMKINRVKVDEYNSWIRFTPIVLRCPLKDETMIRATISLSNRIALKVNNRLFE